MANEAYRVKVDTSLPRALRKVDELVDGQIIYETEGRTYDAGQVVLAEDITPPLREAAENGELDDILEQISRDEALAELGVQESRVVIPEHEAEAVVLEEGGATVVPRDQLLELKAAGSEGAKSALEAAKKDELDVRPNIADDTRPPLSEVSNDISGGTNNVPSDSEHVADELLEGVEQPPGLPVGSTLAEAEGGEAPKPRQRPKRQEKSQSASEKKADE
jgi:hypothetical protein